MDVVCGDWKLLELSCWRIPWALRLILSTARVIPVDGVSSYGIVETLEALELALGGLLPDCWASLLIGEL